LILKEISQLIRQRIVKDVWLVYNVCLNGEIELDKHIVELNNQQFPVSILNSKSIIKSDGFLIDVKLRVFIIQNSILNYL
jgi:hypothetical protein